MSCVFDYPLTSLVHYSLTSKIQTGIPGKRWFKTASYIGQCPVILFWIKYNNKNSKFITFFK